MPLDPSSTGSVSQKDLGSSLAGIRGPLLAHQTIANAGDNFDFSSIDQGYLDLLLIVFARGVYAAFEDALGLRFNGDSTAGHYSSEWAAAATGGGMNGNEDPNNVRGYGAYIVGSNAGANIFSVAQIWFPGYTSTAWYKM